MKKNGGYCKYGFIVSHIAVKERLAYTTKGAVLAMTNAIAKDYIGWDPMQQRLPC